MHGAVRVREATAARGGRAPRFHRGATVVGHVCLLLFRVINKITQCPEFTVLPQHGVVRYAYSGSTRRGAPDKRASADAKNGAEIGIRHFALN